MPRGTRAKLGDICIAQNGYSYTQTELGRKLTHHLVAEKKLGRPLKGNERVSFADGDKTNFDPKNIMISIKGENSINKRIARINSQIYELEQERSALLELQRETKLRKV
jgi:hypothetical protein